MSKSSYALGIIIGVLIGAVIVYGYFTNEITDYNRILTKFTTESAELDQLKEDYRKLQNDYHSLNTEYLTLTGEYLALQRDNQELEYDLEHAETNWKSLSTCVTEFMEVQDSYVNTEDSFSRVINSLELEKIAYKIEEVSKKEEYNWGGYWNIHKYVRDEIKYSYDPEIPIIGAYRFFTESGSQLLSEFDITTRENLLQSLSYTVEYQQGDCDDQAILEYAMIQYYGKYIYGTMYALYLAMVSFENGDNHLAVFMPVQDGNICILDPAGQYQTGTGYSIQTKKAGPELYNYEEHWKSENGEIIEIILWDIDIDTGESSEEFKGSLADAVVFFSK